MPRGKQEPDIFSSYVPPAPKRAIVVSPGTMAFCRALYALALVPDNTWRAITVEQAREMQATWRAEGIESFIVPLPEMLRGSEPDDEMADEVSEARRARKAA